MKKFNLEEALAGKPVVTRDGRKVRSIIKFDVDYFPVVAIIEGREDVATFTLNGEYSHATFTLDGEYRHTRCNNDLFMATVKNKGYVNLYDVISLFCEEEGQICEEEGQTDNGNLLAHTTSVLPTVEDARKLAMQYPAIAVAVPVEWEE